MTNQSASIQLLNHYFQPIAPLLSMEGVTNIFVNRYDLIYYESQGRRHTWDSAWKNEGELISAIHTLSRSLRQPLDESEPLLDARLDGGSRVNAVLPPVGEYASMSIRVFPETAISGDQLVSWGAMTQEMLDYLQSQVSRQSNLVISGCVDSGKTTLMKILIDSIPSDHRLVIIEDTKEIQVSSERHPDYIQLEAPQRRDSLGVRRVTMGRLIKNALRMSPAALVLGEVRDSEAATALRDLMNTGIRGILATLHANDAEDTLIRLQNLVSETSPNTSYQIVSANLRRNIHVVVNCTHEQGHGRRISEIAELSGESLQIVFRYNKHSREFEDLR